MTSLETAAQYLDQKPELLLGEWYDDYHRRTFGIGPDEATSVAGDLRTLFDAWCERLGLHDSVCTKWRYCEQKDNHSNAANLAAALADFVAPTVGLSTNGACAVSILLLQGGLNLACKCKGAT